MKFTKAELKVIHDSLIHNLTMLEAFSILENDDKEIDTKETRLMNYILVEEFSREERDRKKISKVK